MEGVASSLVVGDTANSLVQALGNMVGRGFLVEVPDHDPWGVGGDCKSHSRCVIHKDSFFPCMEVCGCCEAAWTCFPRIHGALLLFRSILSCHTNRV